MVCTTSEAWATGSLDIFAAMSDGAWSPLLAATRFQKCRSHAAAHAIWGKSSARGFTSANVLTGLVGAKRAALQPLHIKDVVKLGHFDLRFAESRRELLHGSFLPVSEKREPRAGMPMPFQ